MPIPPSAPPNFTPSLLQDLSRTEQLYLSMLLVQEIYVPGDVVVLQGQWTDFLFFVNKGFIQVRGKKKYLYSTCNTICSAFPLLFLFPIRRSWRHVT
jgi:di/tricarboxylate transporter